MWHAVKFSIALVCTALVASNAGAEAKKTLPPPVPKIGTSVADYMVSHWTNLSDASCGVNCFSVDYSKVPAEAHPKGWDYTNGVALSGMWKLYLKTNNTKYFDYIKNWVDMFVKSDGSVPLSLDQNIIQPAVLLAGLYEKTNDERYLKAMTAVRNNVDLIQKNDAGAFWHNPSLPNQQWLDAFHKTHPFLVAYASKYADSVKAGDAATVFNISTAQFKIAFDHLLDPSAKLLHHAWTGSADKVWTGLSKNPPVTGTVVSPFMSCRSMGWYFAALMDVLEVLPFNHVDRPTLVHIAKVLAEGLVAKQDATGLWYQVLDVRNDKLPANGGYPNETMAALPNWLETSGSALMTYGFAKGVRIGVLPCAMQAAAVKGWKGIQSKVDISGSNVTIHGGVASMDVGGTYNSYVNADFRTDLTTGDVPFPLPRCATPPPKFNSYPLDCKYMYVRDNSPPAVGTVMLAASEMEYAAAGKPAQGQTQRCPH